MNNNENRPMSNIESSSVQPTDTTANGAQQQKGISIPMVALLGILMLAGGIIAGYYLLPGIVNGEHDHSEAETLYTCPMHPQVIENHQGVCPICHMDLVPMHNTGQAGTGGADAAHDAMIHVTPRDRVLAAIATVRVTSKPFGATVTASAGVEYNEGTRRVISARYSGRIERLAVNRTGQYVKQGEPLLELYSPQLIAAQKEYLIALETERLGALPAGGLGREPKSDRGRGLVEISRKRLALLGMTNAQIAELEQKGEVAYSTTIYSPVSGVVLNRAVTEGAYVNEGTTLVELVDLRSVWVIANIPEADIPRVAAGMEIMISGSGLGSKTLTGKVDYMYPAIDPQTRTAQVRGLFTNPGGILKPGMYLTATLQAQSGAALAVPERAVIRTGKRNVVYVEVEQNMFQPREVQLGVKSDGYYEITGGNLKEGEHVVAEGGYLLDSERQLSSSPAVDPHAGHTMPIEGSK